MASSEERAAMVATGAQCLTPSRAAVAAALLLLSERVARAGTLLADRTGRSAEAAAAGGRRAATPLVAMAVMEFCPVMAVLRAVTAARRSQEMASSEEMAATAATGAM